MKFRNKIQLQYHVLFQSYLTKKREVTQHLDTNTL